MKYKIIVDYNICHYKKKCKNKNKCEEGSVSECEKFINNDKSFLKGYNFGAKK